MTASIDKPIVNPLRACSDALADVVERVGAATVAVGTPRHPAIASGVVWRPGVLVTVAHVFRRTPAAASIVMAGGEEADAVLVGLDTATDLAVFRLPPQAALPQAELAGDAALRTGELAIAVGRSGRGELSSSFGMVNRVGAAWQTWLGGELDRLIRLDGGLHDGLSGGPVADASGRVVGIGSAALARGYGVVVPEATVNRVVDALLARGRVARAFLGIGAQPVPLPAGAPAEAGPAGGDAEPATGLLITSLVPEGPAARAGVLIGDIVRAVGGHSAASLGALRGALSGQIGERLPLALLRGGVAAELSVEVGEWPADARRCG